MTNYEKIKAMSVEEMAELFGRFSCLACPVSLECEKEVIGRTCDELVEEWLLQEAEE